MQYTYKVAKLEYKIGSSACSKQSTGSALLVSTANGEECCSVVWTKTEALWYITVCGDGRLRLDQFISVSSTYQIVSVFSTDEQILSKWREYLWTGRKRTTFHVYQKSQANWKRNRWQSYKHRLHVHDLVNFNPADVLTGSGVSRRNYRLRLGYLVTLTKMGGACSVRKVCKNVNFWRKFWWFKRTLKDNIRRALKETRCVGVN